MHHILSCTWTIFHAFFPHFALRWHCRWTAVPHPFQLSRSSTSFYIICASSIRSRGAWGKVLTSSNWHTSVFSRYCCSRYHKEIFSYYRSPRLRAGCRSGCAAIVRHMTATGGGGACFISLQVFVVMCKQSVYKRPIITKNPSEVHAVRFKKYLHRSWCIGCHQIDWIRQ